jgi:hypothetical protein
LRRLAGGVPDLIRASRMNFHDGVPFRKNAVTGIGERCRRAGNYLVWTTRFRR